MIRLLRRITSSLSAKLILPVCLLVMFGFGLSWYVLIISGKNTLLKIVINNTALYSDLIRKSVRYDMLIFHREAVQNTIENMGFGRDVEKIRIFDHRGRVSYSSQPGEIGRLIERSSTACVACHTDPLRPSEVSAGDRRWLISEGRDRHRILASVDPIYNEPSCYTAACHVHPQSQKILGILQTEFSLFSVDEDIRKKILYMTLYAFGFLGTALIIPGLFLWRFVQKPISVLSKGMQKAAEGDLNQRVDITSQDEIGLIAGRFNVMTENLQKTTVSRDLLAKEVDERRRIEDELRKSEEKYKNLFDSTMDGVYQTDAEGIFTMMNQAGARIFGFERPEEIIGTNAMEFWRDPKDRDAYRAELKIRKSLSAYPISAKNKDGEPLDFESSSRIMEDDKGNFLGIEGILRDVTERKRAEEELRQLSVIDELTGLNNRRGFLILAIQQIKNADRSKQSAVLVYADIDKMKWVNDTFGHHEGDRALIDVANILKRTLRASDIIARWGGDEFVALVFESTEKGGEVVLARLQENMKAHNLQGIRPYKLSISFGLTRYDPENPCALEELLERADKLMYEQKQKRKMGRAE